MSKAKQVAGTEDIQRRIGALVVAFRAETQIELPDGYARLDAESGDKLDTEDGDFAWWCSRHEVELTQHGLYLEHPSGTVIRAWQSAKGSQPQPWAHLSVRAPASHERVHSRVDSPGYAPGMTYKAWLAQEHKDRAGKGGD